VVEGTHNQVDGGVLGSGREEGRAAREGVARTRVGAFLFTVLFTRELLEVGDGEKETGLGLGSIPCRILGKHHTPTMGGRGGGVDLQYIGRKRLGVQVIQYKTIYNTI
jgi:hypothetical protein